MPPESWTELSDAELLERKISQLKLTIAGTVLEPLVQQLYQELAAKGLTFMPPCHVGDEWFCPEGYPVIFIPFYLTHPRLRELERKMILEVEGETESWFMRLIRHEAGHAYSYAYRLYKKKKWQSHFGLASTKQSDFYRPRPYSRSYVIHLDDWYAQSHPDEDFAETFAVWLTPNLDWRNRYAGWKALSKLEYVDELMQSIAGKPPLHDPHIRVADFNCLNQKLKTYYNNKRELYAESYPDFYDNDLKRLFPSTEDSGRTEKASHFLRLHRRQILDAVCLWTNERRYRVNQLLGKLMRRCDELGLIAGADPAPEHLKLASFITCLVMNYLFTGRFKRSK